MREWSYLLYAFAGVGVAALKGFLYAHVLNEAEYAAIGYYLLILGVGGLAVGSGVMLRAHTELPSMGERQRYSFVAQGRAVGFVFWWVLSIPSLLFGSLFWDFGLLLLALLQVLIMFLFTLDVVVRKSKGDFIGYARSVFLRNLVLMSGGLFIAYLTGSAWCAILCEVLCGLLACSGTLVNWFLNFRFPRVEYLKRSLRFVPVSVLGGVGQYIDRLCASVFLSVAAFSLYSYLSLLMVGALAVQQIINTRVITLLAIKCQASPRQAYLYLLKISISVFGVCLMLMSFAAYLLFFSIFSVSWVDVDPVIVFLFALGVSFKAADFFSSYLVVMHRKKILMYFQLVCVLSYAVLAAISYSAGFGFFVVAMVLGMIIFSLVLMLVSWRVSLA